MSKNTILPQLDKPLQVTTHNPDELVRLPQSTTLSLRVQESALTVSAAERDRLSTLRQPNNS